MFGKKSAEKIDGQGAKKRDRRGTWPQAIASLLFSVLIILAIRWALLEPYIIPSGSMVPTLLIHDHIFVNKFAYGVRIPFSQKWLLQWSSPKRGEIIVFRSVEDPKIFLIKRVVGLPGDHLEITSRSLKINGKEAAQLDASDSEKASFIVRQEQYQGADLNFDFKTEDLDGFKHILIYERNDNSTLYDQVDLDDLADTENPKIFEVPEGHYFMMGDNRDHSGDSRMWGTLPFENVLGRASIIWLSCEKMVEGSSRICDFSKLRTERLFSRVR
jgi:signal peptidase I